MFDYKLLEAFATVIREGGFERAAREIHITQSAVSQRIKHLEEQFGQVLLQRTTPPKPTSAGKNVLKLYNQVRHLEDDLKGILEPDERNSFTTIPVGINADTLDTWFYEAIRPFLEQERVVLDLFVDDQERTHRFLRDGKVLGCISTRSSAIQGCRIEYIGEVAYGLYCSNTFAEKWFPDGLELERLTQAPILCFTRDDELNNKIFQQIFGILPEHQPTNYIPSAVMFTDLIKGGMAYGVLPEQQSRNLLRKGGVVDLAPQEKVKVQLYWHCSNLKSRLLQSFTEELLRGFTGLSAADIKI